ncbi:hypothetical protein EG832_02295, partial [bacterium]|nr:hypothetical protein [bacterium]
MKTTQKLILVFSLSIITVACSTTTQLRKTWSDPSLSQNPVAPFNKVLIMATPRDEANRIVAEDKLVSLMKSGTAIPSYK